MVYETPRKKILILSEGKAPIVMILYSVIPTPDSFDTSLKIVCGDDSNGMNIDRKFDSRHRGSMATILKNGISTLRESV